MSSRAPKRPLATQRGVAMLIAVISIAVLTVVATDFAYNQRVDLQLAANHRDEIRAYYLARSGIGLSRLLLKFQRQLDQTPIPNPMALLQQFLGPAAGGGATGAAAPSTMSLQLWRMARVDCHMLQGMVTSAPADERQRLNASSDFDKEFPEEAQRQKQRNFGTFEGCFSAQISDEQEKLNLARLDAPGLTGRALVLRAMDLFADKRFEFLFEEEDRNRVKVLPNEVLINLRDWIDEDEVQAAVNLTQQGEPFLRGFSDESSPYSRYTPAYQAKNARFDSLDELYLVHGINDAFMAAFKDRLTVYPDVNQGLNVNTDDPVLLYLLIQSVADPLKPDPRLRDPLFIDEVIKRIRSARVFSVFGMSAADFVNVVEAAGVTVNASIKGNIAQNRMVSDKSTTYSIKAVGEAGSVQKTISAVVSLDDGLGKLLYWREE